MHDDAVLYDGGFSACRARGPWRGVAAAAAPTFQGVRNILGRDRAAEAVKGAWVTTGRMRTLRSPKTLPGIALGIPAAT